MHPRLSICIATLNRGAFIGETLDTIVSQLCDDTELLVVDGASRDNTAEIVSRYTAADSRVRYICLPANSGVDQDYDITVSHARGDYCWLMTDDDLLKPGAVARVMATLDGNVELVIVNTEVRTADFGSTLRPALVASGTNPEYAPDDADRLLIGTANALSFIGCVVISRSFWNARDRVAYYGSLFIHVGVIFQSQTPLTHLIVEPLITVRYGNAMWTPRGFEIWMFKWPSLVWSFGSVSAQAKTCISPREPWRQLRKLLLYRSIGGYSRHEYDRFLAKHPMPAYKRLLSRVIAVIPPGLANALSSLYCGIFARHARMNIYDLARSPHASFVSRVVARSVGF
ncbi:glycosyltransferase [Rhodanobacter denitrificans]|uniref:glycosyltransferase family 2 protein n=1 Tax=Rhodanobacter denitrificans TaxID=666685 RepID=UPI000260E678|nr:glycosyltransferase family 2 protein [Rhodanobacter denitrificans]EIL99428.1 glycosyl transferase family protein [Rhodanobacter denitrificans]UJM89712.1 glycosyltransferase [Rhodanobacter denitrificans]